MAIRITKLDGGYVAEVTPPHGGSTPWGIGDPRSADDLIALLRDRGCHPTDTGDAFYEADPSWLEEELPGAREG
jgi:hypothetical protein